MYPMQYFSAHPDMVLLCGRVGGVPHPGTASLSRLDLWHHFHPGGGTQSVDPGVRHLQTHPEQMLQEQGQHEGHGQHRLWRNTNERKDEGVKYLRLLSVSPSTDSEEFQNYLSARTNGLIFNFVCTVFSPSCPAHP